MLPTIPRITQLQRSITILPTSNIALLLPQPYLPSHPLRSRKIQQPDQHPNRNLQAPPSLSRRFRGSNRGLQTTQNYLRVAIARRSMILTLPKHSSNYGKLNTLAKRRTILPHVLRLRLQQLPRRRREKHIQLHGSK